MSEFRPGRFQVLPSVVKNIIIINVLMVLLQFVLGQNGIDLSNYLGLHYWKSPLFHWWQLITHIFMHGTPTDLQATILHIFSNMFALWMFGSILENTWGPKRFLLFYMVCGLGAAFCHMGVLTYEHEKFEHAFNAYQQSPTLDHYAIFIKQEGLNKIAPFIELYRNWSIDPASIAASNNSIQLIHSYYMVTINEATVGASGAVFGVLFAFGYLFPNTLIYLYFFVPLKAKWFVGLYALFELYSGIRNSAGDNIAHFAHLGGMLFAFILLKIWNNRMRNQFY